MSGMYFGNVRGVTYAQAGWWSVALVVGLSVLTACGQESEVDQPTTQPGVVTTQPSTAPAGHPGVERTADGKLEWDRPRVAERQAERERMVRTQIAGDATFRDAVKNDEVLEALRAVPRHEFVPPGQRRRAYADTPLPIGYGQTISQPYIVALMTSLLELEAGERVLEIGTGSGYQAAVLSELTPYVYSIEIIEELHEQAEERYERMGYETIRARAGDGYNGWPTAGPFDAIIVTCAAGHVPPPLWEQLKPGGRMVIPVGGVYETQRLLLLMKQGDGTRRTRNVLPVRFVPMTGKIQRR